jgi:peroxiredoxin
VNSLIREKEEIVYLGREELEGTEVLSFEMELDPAMREEIDATGQLAQLGIRPEKLQAMIGVADGFPRLWQLVDATGQALVSVMYRNVDLNPELSPERFEYTPSEDSEVMDLSVLAGDLLSNLNNGGDLESNPQIQELLGDLNIELNEPEAEEEEAATPDFSKYNTNFSPGDRAPVFEGKSLRGGTIDLADYQGKVVLLDFWIAGSKPYLRDLDALIDIYARHQGEDFEIIGINLDTDREAVEAFLEAHPGVSWPQVFDGKGWSSEVGTLYGIGAIPHRILIGRDGVIAKAGLMGKGLPREVDQFLAE